MAATKSHDFLGGFIIQCNDGGTVSVTADQAVKLFEKCQYFKNVFRHGTKENEEFILKKPDWSTETAQCIIGLLVNGSTSTSVDKYPILLEAADQILVEIKVCCPMKIKTFLNDEEVHKVLALANEVPVCKIRSSNNSVADVWNECLQNNILFFNDEKMIDLEIQRRHVQTESTTPCGLFAFADIDMLMNVYSLADDNFNDYSELSLTIYSNLSLTSAILKIGDIFRLKVKRGEKIFHNEELSIRVPSPSFSFAILVRKNFDNLKEKINISGFLHSASSPGYFLGGNNDVVHPNCPTLFGSAEKLKTALDAILQIDSSIKFCSLRIAAPSPQTLEKLTRACQRCVDNPGTLGVQFESNAFFVVKSIRDIKIMLDILSGNESYSPNTDVLEIVHLKYPKGIF
mmetsp:Transcript_14229/g.20395  ORF Transcript_14229/g.20395 Transcript_14229/m.20395 type:complete len:401 (-) Transcript_14229:1051-2253(-)|eukprot:CAMPEP_0172427604 /NCGR_PEP_ID=MMETSP1064-20121228/42681_1 /TAXON_ID=202472 /ORGANISM="Aulacoseira subarctica , Strain CCAP 1002/5" /LENGTH=400 /DNA_ID=CAMNT_0013171885 /DNA_START=47 /DNA_END=1249 /DNA_ORIENTATION=+